MSRRSQQLSLAMRNKNTQSRFKPPQDPIRADWSKPTIEPTPEWSSKFQSSLMALNADKAGTDAERDQWRREIVKKEAASLPEAANDAFMNGFQSYLMGHMKDNDLTPVWGQRDRQLTDVTGVADYLKGLTSARADFEKYIVLMKQMGPIGPRGGAPNINTNYLYYKYCLAGNALSESNYLKDFSIFKNVLDDDLNHELDYRIQTPQGNMRRGSRARMAKLGRDRDHARNTGFYRRNADGTPQRRLWQANLPLANSFRALPDTDADQTGDHVINAELDASHEKKDPTMPSFRKGPSSRTPQSGSGGGGPSSGGGTDPVLLQKIEQQADAIQRLLEMLEKQARGALLGGAGGLPPAGASADDLQKLLEERDNKKKADKEAQKEAKRLAKEAAKVKKEEENKGKTPADPNSVPVPTPSPPQSPIASRTRSKSTPLPTTPNLPPLPATPSPPATPQLSPEEERGRAAEQAEINTPSPSPITPQDQGRARRSLINSVNVGFEDPDDQMVAHGIMMLIDQSDLTDEKVLDNLDLTVMRRLDSIGTDLADAFDEYTRTHSREGAYQALHDLIGDRLESVPTTPKFVDPNSPDLDSQGSVDSGFSRQTGDSDSEDSADTQLLDTEPTTMFGGLFTVPANTPVLTSTGMTTARNTTADEYVVPIRDNMAIIPSPTDGSPSTVLVKGPVQKPNRDSYDMNSPIDRLSDRVDRVLAQQGEDEYTSDDAHAKAAEERRSQLIDMGLARDDINVPDRFANPRSLDDAKDIGNVIDQYAARAAIEDEAINDGATNPLAAAENLRNLDETAAVVNVVAGYPSAVNHGRSNAVWSAIKNNWALLDVNNRMVAEARAAPANADIPSLTVEQAVRRAPRWRGADGQEIAALPQYFDPSVTTEEMVSEIERLAMDFRSVFTPDIHTPAPGLLVRRAILESNPAARSAWYQLSRAMDSYARRFSSAGTALGQTVVTPTMADAVSLVANDQGVHSFLTPPDNARTLPDYSANETRRKEAVERKRVKLETLRQKAPSQVQTERESPEGPSLMRRFSSAASPVAATIARGTGQALRFTGTAALEAGKTLGKAAGTAVVSTVRAGGSAVASGGSALLNTLTAEQEEQIRTSPLSPGASTSQRPPLEYGDFVESSDPKRRFSIRNRRLDTSGEFDAETDAEPSSPAAPNPFETKTGRPKRSLRGLEPKNVIASPLGGRRHRSGFTSPTSGEDSGPGRRKSVRIADNSETAFFDSRLGTTVSKGVSTPTKKKSPKRGRKELKKMPTARSIARKKKEEEDSKKPSK